MPTDFTSPETIRKFAADCAAALEDPNRPYQGWCSNLAAYLSRVARTPVAERATLEFQEELWSSETISATGQGHVSVSAALEDDGFRRWLAEKSVAELPDDDVDAAAYLSTFHDELKERVLAFGGRTPRLKMFRVLATLFPYHFTTIADVSVLDRLHRAMVPEKKRHAVEKHLDVLRKIETVLGPAPRDLRGMGQANDPPLAHRESAR